MNVLIAEDDDSCCKFLRALLEGDGHAVFVAADGQEALGLLEHHWVDAIISDLLMPNMDGYRLCREIRREKRWRDVPFICYTGIYGSMADEKMAFDLGADAYLRKPAPSDIILGALRASIGGVGARPSRPEAEEYFYLPAVQGPAERSPQSTPAQRIRRHETILLVEDEDPVREINALLLESLGYRVLKVSDAEEALQLIQNEQVKIDLLFTDVIMPGMSGRELAEVFRAQDPSIKILFQSGYTDDMVVRNGILQAEVPFLQKPFNIDALAKKIRSLLDQK